MNLLRCATLLVLLVLALGCDDPEVLAEVGSAKLRRADLQRVLRQQPNPEPAKALENLISRQLLAEQARAEGLDKRLSAELAAAQREVLAQVVLNRELAKLTNDDALRQLYLASQEKLKKRQAQLRYLQVTLPHAQTPAQREAAQAKINALHARLMAGEALEKVVQEASQDASQPTLMRDLGMVREGEVHPAFFDAAWGLAIGAYSKPFETSFGYHVVQATGPQETVVPMFIEVRSQLAADARKEGEAKLVADLAKKFPIKRHPERLSTLDAGRPVDGGS